VTEGDKMLDHILRMAGETGKRLTIIYSKDDRITKREIRVVGISGDSILAYCYLRKQMRTFKKTNILAAAFIEMESA
jgi:predicted DNA-binding transcriptional regulator YafY